MKFDFYILDFIQDHLSNSFFDFLMPALTSLGNNGTIWIILAIILLIIPKTRKTGAVMAVSLIIEALICNIILKPLVARERPFANKDIELLIPKPKDYSFPSGHTGASFASVGALFFSGSEIWIPSFILALLIAFSRLYLYVHYPTDVLAGILLGILSGYAGYIIVKKINEKYRRNKLEKNN